MYTQKIQSCHQDFQIRKVTCGLRSKTIVTHRNFRTPEDPSESMCDLGLELAKSTSFRAWTRRIFGNGVPKSNSRRAEIELRLEKGTCNGRRSRPSARAAEREGGPSLSSSGIFRETCGVRVEALGARPDSDQPCKGSCGARKRPRGVARGGARTGCGRAAAGKRAFAINGRCREVGTRLPPRGRARADSGRRLVGLGGFGPNLSCIT